MQVVEGSDSGQKPDTDVATTDSDGPVETHVSNPPSLQKLYTKEPNNDLGIRQVLYNSCILMQEVEGCDVGEDFDIDNVPTEPCVSNLSYTETVHEMTKEANGRKLLSLYIRVY